MGLARTLRDGFAHEPFSAPGFAHDGAEGFQPLQINGATPPGVAARARQRPCCGHKIEHEMRA